MRFPRDPLSDTGVAVLRLFSRSQPTLLRPSNKTFVPASEPRISIYAGRGAELAPFTGAGPHFIDSTFSNPEAAVR
jgi:hypothetical protein